MDGFTIGMLVLCGLALLVLLGLLAVHLVCFEAGAPMLGPDPQPENDPSGIVRIERSALDQLLDAVADKPRPGDPNGDTVSRLSVLSCTLCRGLGWRYGCPECGQSKIG